MSTGNGNAFAGLPNVDLYEISREFIATVDIEGDDGKKRRIGMRSFDGFTARAATGLKDGEQAMGRLHEIAQHLLPDATPTEIERLTPKAVLRLVEASGEAAAKVEAAGEAFAEKNGRGSASPPSKQKRKGSRATSSRSTR